MVTVTVAKCTLECSLIIYNLVVTIVVAGVHTRVFSDYMQSHGDCRCCHSADQSVL